MILKITRLLFASLEVGYFSFPIIISTLVFFIPCQQPFLGSIILPPTSCQVPSKYVRIILATFEFIPVHYLALAAGIFPIALLFGGMVHMWLHISKLRNTTGLSFIRKYRELQVFEKLFNSCNQGRIFPVLVTLCPVIEILGAFACVRLRGEMIPLEFTFIMMETKLVTGFTLAFFSGAGKINTGSGKLLRACKAGENRTETKKVLATLIPLKVRFGQNFVDGLTPLILQQFCTIQMANLLLLF